MKRGHTLILGLLPVDHVEAAGLDLAVDERTGKASPANAISATQTSEAEDCETYRSSLAVAWSSGWPFSATWFS